MPPVEDAPVELEHAIGISTIRGGLHYHPNGREYTKAAGASIIVCNFDDPHDQSFLRGHDDSVVCVALSPHGTYVASGQSGENADASCGITPQSPRLFIMTMLSKRWPSPMTNYYYVRWVGGTTANSSCGI